jgi:hypothetical protein
MPTPLSMDLRVRVLAAVAQGLSHRQVGERFGVSFVIGLVGGRPIACWARMSDSWR